MIGLARGAGREKELVLSAGRSEYIVVAKLVHPSKWWQQEPNSQDTQQGGFLHNASVQVPRIIRNRRGRRLPVTAHKLNV
jgi:hypothetical protein